MWYAPKPSLGTRIMVEEIAHGSKVLPLVFHIRKCVLSTLCECKLKHAGLLHEVHFNVKALPAVVCATAKLVTLRHEYTT